MKKPTIYDLAEKTGVSPATVSRAFNTPEKVSSAIREKIERTCQELGYTKKQKNDKKKSSDCTIGLIFPRLDNPFFSIILSGIQESSQGKHISLILMTNKEARNRLLESREYLASLDGIIYIPSENHESIEHKLHTLEIPLVFVDRRAESQELFNYVGVNNRRSAQNAARYLLSLNHKNMVFLSGPENLSTEEERLEGVRDAYMKSGIDSSCLEVINCPFNKEEAHERTLKLLETRNDITAIFAGDDIMAYGVLQALEERGLRCPEDISVMGFDDISTSALLGLTTVHQPAYMMGKNAFHLISDLIQGTAAPGQQILLNSSLVIRNSCRVAHI